VKIGVDAGGFGVCKFALCLISWALLQSFDVQTLSTGLKKGICHLWVSKFESWLTQAIAYQCQEWKQDPVQLSDASLLCLSINANADTSIAGLFVYIRNLVLLSHSV